MGESVSGRKRGRKRGGIDSGRERVRGRESEGKREG